MEKLADILEVGGKTNSLGRSSEVVSSVLADKTMLDELYACLFSGDAWVQMRAADCIEKVCRVHPDWIEPYINRILNDLTTSNQPSIQWHLAQIFAEVDLSDGQRKKAVAWLKRLLSFKELDWIVSVNSMKTLIQFYHNGLVSKYELLPLLELQQQHKSQAVQKKAAQFLQDLCNA